MLENPAVLPAWQGTLPSSQKRKNRIGSSSGNNAEINKIVEYIIHKGGQSTDPGFKPVEVNSGDRKST